METSNPVSSELDQGRWQWKSPENPFLPGQEEQWTPYSREQNDLLEKAFYEGRPEVDIGDYIVSIKHFIQRKKGNLVLQRPIRRIDHHGSQETIERGERYFDTELPKTMNGIFGNLKDMLEFFIGRNQEIHDFSIMLLQIIEEENLDQLLSKVIPAVIDCIQKESLTVKEVTLNKKLRLLRELFGKQDLSSFEQFFMQILKAYSLGTFLYRNINKYLREEDWTALDNLLPYLVCLCLGFWALPETATLMNDPSAQSLQNIEKAKSIILLRGTALSPKDLEEYDRKKIVNFSWYSVTSTTTNKEVAEKFMKQSADSTQKLPVLFQIEIPLIEQKKTLSYLNIQTFSSYPEEDEVILPPGSAFEIISVTTNDRFSEIKLRLISDIEKLAREGLVMPGNRQTKISTTKQAVFVFLKGSTLAEQFRHYAGNQLIQFLIFKQCEFNEEAFEKLIEVLPKIPNLRVVEFQFCSYQGIKQYIQNKEAPNLKHIEIYLVANFDFIQSICQAWSKYWGSLARLSLEFPNATTIGGSMLSALCSGGLQNLADLTSLSLYFNKESAITDEGIEILCCEGFQYLERLQSLKVSFQKNNDLTENGMVFLFSKGLKYLKNLGSLELNFLRCEKITEKSLMFVFNQDFSHLSRLEFLSLNFSLRKISKEIAKANSNMIRQERLEPFFHNEKRNLDFNILKGLPSLISLTLNFSEIQIIPDKEIDFLAYLQNFQDSLLKLDLVFTKKIPDVELNSLCSTNGLQSLKRLTTLSLSFNECRSFIEKEVLFLCQEGLQCLTQLQSLHIEFKESRVTDDLVDILYFQGLQPLTQLKTLRLSFIDCFGLCSEKLQSSRKQIEQLANYSDSWSLDYKRSEKPRRSSIDVEPHWVFKRKIHSNEFCVEELINLPSTLKLDERMTHERIHQELSDLPSPLEGLNLKLESSELDDGSQIMGKFTNFLASKKLNQLKKLNIKLWNSSDKAIDILATKGLKYLSSLESFEIYIFRCSEITDKSIESLVKEGFKHIPQLKTLILRFLNCGITGNGTRMLLNESIPQLQNLAYLELDFTGCPCSSDLADSFLSNTKQMRCYGFDWGKDFTAYVHNFRTELPLERIFKTSFGKNEDLKEVFI